MRETSWRVEWFKYTVEDHWSDPNAATCLLSGADDMAMQEISLDKAKEIAVRKKLVPGRVKGTLGIQFTRGNNERLEVIGWDEFDRVMHDNNLAVYESNGWMKIMKRS